MVLTPPQHGQYLEIGKTRIIVKVVSFFLFRNPSSERQFKASNPDATEAGGFIKHLVRILPPLLQNRLFSLGKQGFGDDSGDSLDDAPRS